MTTVRQSAKKALETYLKEQNDALAGNALATQWPNTKYEGEEGVAYQKVDFIFTDPQDPELSTFFQETGIMQVMLLYPAGDGEGDAITRAEILRGWFPKGLNLSADGVNVTVNRTPKIASGASDGSRYAVPVQIRFYANNAN